jgi:recombinational DNA repair ATPase RecF
MSSILTEICNWATQLEYWEQAALDKIIAVEKLTPADYDQILQLMLEDKDLVERKSQHPEIQVARHIENSGSSSAQRVRLLEVSNLQNINALAADQKITFDDHLTIIFGANGSGKSGYARVLGQAGFSRGDRDVLSDIDRPPSDNVRRSADIRVADENGERVINFVIGEPCPDLANLHAFDSTSVKVHLNEQNTISFTPPGLSLLTALAAETDKCRELLRGKIADCKQAHSFGPHFQGETEVSRLIAGLGPKTNVKDLQKLATLSPGETERLADLETQIGRLKSEDITEKLKELDVEITDLRGLIKNIRAVEEGLSDKTAGDLNMMIAEFQSLLAATRSAGIEQFRSKNFTQTGTPVWNEFIKAAKALAEAESENRNPYPHAEDHCLFCRQSLSSEARDLILRLWDHLKNEAQTKLRATEREIEKNDKALKAIELNYFNDQFVAYRRLAQHSVELNGNVTTFFQVASQRRERMLHAIQDLVDCAPSPLPENGIKEIETLIESLTVQRSELASRDRKDEIAKLEKERLELEHRMVLGKYFEEIAAYIEKQKWAAKAEKACGTTAHITRKYNDLFEKRVTERYKELFEKLLKDMGRPLKVHVSTKGKKGATIKQIVLKAEDKRVTPDKVLSEGEKRAVAMADFLTEVTLNESSGGIVLDDPVTSLDTDWKDTVAQKLIDEAQRRQVILFTHDLQFVHVVNRHAELGKVSLRIHQIYRRGPDDQPGFVELDHSPIQEKSYLNPSRAEKFCGDAEKATSLSEQESLSKDGFGALRSCYEALVAHDIFGNVVRRFDARITVGGLKDVILDQSILNEVIAKFELLSRYIEGHLPIDGLEIPAPTPALLKKEIQAFRELKSKLKKLKNSR